MTQFKLQPLVNILFFADTVLFTSSLILLTQFILHPIYLYFRYFSSFHINSKNNLLLTSVIIGNINLVFPNRITLF